ncbi:hypothetical protein IKO70_08985 [bacterium]|nr:hypothetical protein [bacterium]
MKKILFLLFITAAFLYGCASAESEKDVVSLKVQKTTLGNTEIENCIA